MHTEGIVKYKHHTWACSMIFLKIDNNLINHVPMMDFNDLIPNYMRSIIEDKFIELGWCKKCAKMHYLNICDKTKLITS